MSVNVTRALGECRNISNTRDAGSSPKTFIVQKKESFVSHDRTAQRSAKLVQAQWRVGNTEKVARVKRIVAKEFVGGSVQRIAARLGHEINHGAAIAPIFRRKRVRLDFEFLNRVN